MSEEINHARRRLLGTAAMAIAAVPLSTRSWQFDQALSPIKPEASTTFGPLKQIDAGVLLTRHLC